jgi:hypothetical protein
MSVNTVLFASILSTAVAMAAAFAHLPEMPSKPKLSGQEYLTVQADLSRAMLVEILHTVASRFAPRN